MLGAASGRRRQPQSPPFFAGEGRDKAGKEGGGGIDSKFNFVSIKEKHSQPTDFDGLEGIQFHPGNYIYRSKISCHKNRKVECVELYLLSMYFICFVFDGMN